jgi:hypothetical protein
VLGLSSGSGCAGTELAAPVVVKSYYQDQLRNVAVELTAITGTAHGLCNPDAVPAGLSGAFDPVENVTFGGANGVYAYGTLDSLATRGTPQFLSKTWAFNYADATPFWIGYRAWAELWPAAGTVTTPLGGAILDGGTTNYPPFLQVTQADPEVTGLLSRLFTDPGLTSAVAGSDVVNAANDGLGLWDVNPNDNLVALADNTTYYVGVFSQGLDNGSPQATITGSRYASDWFHFARPISLTAPQGSSPANAETVHQGGRLSWTSSAASTRTRLWVFNCNNQTTCDVNAGVVSGWNGVYVNGSGAMLSLPLTATSYLVSGRYYVWRAQQYFGTPGPAGSLARDLVFKFVNP